MKFRPIFLSVIFLVLSACGMGKMHQALDLEGTSWELLSYDGELPLEGKVMTATFEKGEINGSASCNHYFGSYKIKGDLISIEGLGWTEMACLDPEGIMEQEQAIMKILADSATIKLQDDLLNIMSKSGELLVFSPLDR